MKTYNSCFYSPDTGEVAQVIGGAVEPDGIRLTRRQLDKAVDSLTVAINELEGTLSQSELLRSDTPVETKNGVSGLTTLSALSGTEQHLNSIRDRIYTAEQQVRNLLERVP